MSQHDESNKTLNLYLLRHPESTANVQNILIEGRSDNVGLTHRGFVQAKALGKRLVKEDIKFDIVYTSTAQRTITCASIICSILGYDGEIVAREDLQERSQGNWEGRKKTEIYTPQLLEIIAMDPLNFKPPNGESIADVTTRMQNFITNVLVGKLKASKAPAINAPIFGHGFSFKCLLTGILGSDPNLTHRISIDNCSITQLRYDVFGKHEGWHIIRINDHAHLSKTGYVPNGIIEKV